MPCTGKKNYGPSICQASQLWMENLSSPTIMDHLSVKNQNHAYPICQVPQLWTFHKNTTDEVNETKIGID